MLRFSDDCSRMTKQLHFDLRNYLNRFLIARVSILLSQINLFIYESVYAHYSNDTETYKLGTRTILKMLRDCAISSLRLHLRDDRALCTGPYKFYGEARFTCKYDVHASIS